MEGEIIDLTVDSEREEESADDIPNEKPKKRERLDVHSREGYDFIITFHFYENLCMFYALQYLFH